MGDTPPNRPEDSSAAASSDEEEDDDDDAAVATAALQSPPPVPEWGPVLDGGTPVDTPTGDDSNKRIFGPQLAWLRTGPGAGTGVQRQQEEAGAVGSTLIAGVLNADRSRIKFAVGTSHKHQQHQQDDKNGGCGGSSGIDCRLRVQLKRLLGARLVHLSPPPPAQQQGQHGSLAWPGAAAVDSRSVPSPENVDAAVVIEYEDGGGDDDDDGGEPEGT
eukprot:COSAG01_NODE_2757_length_7128_cov_12.179542_6_plen_217_part_00